MQNPTSFQRSIGLPAATSIVVGSIIGSGIFMRPAEMAALLGSPGWILLVWIIAGLFTLFAGMVSAEIGAMMPRTGGQYMFMQTIYGKFWSYLFGWANFSVINTAGTAGIAFIFAQYFENFVKLPVLSTSLVNSFVIHLPMIGDIFPLQDWGVKILTILVLTAFTLISYISTRLGGRVQLFFTIIKVMSIALLIGGLFFSGKGSFHHFIESSATLHPASILAMIAALVAACNGALQSYDGWANMITVAGEIKNPEKNIPRSLFIGVGICMLIYMAITAAMLYIMPVEQMASSSLVASDAAGIAFGSLGGSAIALLICLSVLGATNGNVLAAPRMTFAMAQEGNFFRVFGKVHKKYNTPGNALWLHLFIMILFVFSGSFYTLTDMYIFVAWLFNLMMISGLFILRKRMPDANRPYKMWGYPWIPTLLLIFTAVYLGFTLYNDITNYMSGKIKIMNSVLGLVLTAAGIPFYIYFRWKNKKDINPPTIL